MILDLSQLKAIISCDKIMIYINFSSCFLLIIDIEFGLNC
jgi:hypothetical protein